MKTSRLTAVFTGVVIGMVIGADVQAYEVSTHRIITAHAVERSQVYNNSSILADIGIASSQGLISSEIIFGVEAEDLVSSDHTIARVFNHFYDPQFNNYQGRGLTVLGTIGHASPDWALEDRGDVVTVGIPGFQFAGMTQENSLREAQRDMWYVLTGQNPATRSQRSIHMLNALGSVVHHLQDMAQPQHTRNEQHAFGPNAYYEGYTQDNIDPSIAALLRAAPNQYPIPQLSSARAYWFSQQTATDQIPRYLGMAEFTAHNFVSSATGFHSDASGNLLPNPDFPRPNGFNQDDGTRKDIVPLNLPIRHLDGTQTNEVGNFVVSHIYDQLLGTTPKTRLVAMSSIFDRPLVTTRGMRAFTVSDGVFNSGYDVLLPRASAFSTGLLDYFFRGRVDIRRNTGGTGWVFENRSGAGLTMNGQVSLWYEEASGLRYPFPGTNTFNIVNLATNAANTLAAGEPPQTARRMIAAFQGQIGSEPANIAGGYYAVAGKIVDYVPPAIPCGSSFSAQGSSAGRETIMELGSTAGRVEGEFEAYYIPDSMVVRRGSSSGPVLYNSNGYVQGFHEFSFQHPGGTDAAQNRIWIKVTGNTDTATLWTSAVSCPGGDITNSNRSQPRVSITFSSTASGKTVGCASGYFDFYLNDLLGTGIVASVPWGGGQGRTSNPITVTAGPNHYLNIVKRTTVPSSPYEVGCGLPAKPVLNRNFQQVDLSLYLNGGANISLP